MSTSATLIFPWPFGNDPSSVPRNPASRSPTSTWRLTRATASASHRLGAGRGLGQAGGSLPPAPEQGDLVCVHAERFQVAVWSAQDKTPQGQLEVTARRVEFIITKRGAAADTGAEEDMPF